MTCFFIELSCSNPIESVVEKQKRGSDLFCTACEMAVVWIQNQLRENKTKELILNYANQVGILCYVWTVL
jgi:phytepsin